MTRARGRDADMTQGNILRQYIDFALPLTVGLLFQQLYSAVDSIVVGNFVGETALGAVGSTGNIINMLIGVCNGLSLGAGAVISQAYGAKNHERISKAVHTTMLMTFLLCIVATAVGVAIVKPSLQLMRTPDSMLVEATEYLTIYFAGIAGLLIYNMGSAILRAVGDSRRPLYFLVFSAVVNTVLDLLFVIRFGMGVAGVAWATLIAQGLCAVASLLVLLRRMRRMPCEPEKQGVKLPLFHMVAVKRIAQIGLPSMLQQSLVSLSMMMQGLVNSFGKVLVAGYTAATKIDTLAMLPNMNFSNAMSSFTAQNSGAGKYERVKEGLKACLLMVAVFSLLITVIIFLFGNQLLSLFLDPGDASGAMGYGLAYMHTVSLFYILMGLLFVPNGMLRGAGDMAAFTFSSMANLFSRVGIAYALVYLTPLGANAIWWSIPAGWLIGAAVSLLRVKSGKWMRKAVADR